MSADGSDPRVVANPAGLDSIAYRVDDFAGFRSALLSAHPHEQTLSAWRPETGDLGLQLLEWWAYLADVLTFYNERIANESYLRTAQLPASVAGLVGLLGYRPRPAIAAEGTLAAIRSTARPDEPLVVPRGTQIASTATPGVDVQTFEADGASFSGPSNVPIALAPDPRLAPSAGEGHGLTLLLQGVIGGLQPGDVLFLVPRAWPEPDGLSGLNWAQVSVIGSAPARAPDGTINTSVDVARLAGADGWIGSAAAADYRLMRWTQSGGLWTQTSDPAPLSVTDDGELCVNLSASVRAVSPGDSVVIDGDVPVLGRVSAVSERFSFVPYPGSSNTPAIPVAHTVLTLAVPDARAPANRSVTGVSIRFGMRDVGLPIATPAATLDTLPAVVATPTNFAPPPDATAFVQDADGSGIPVGVTIVDGGVQLYSIGMTPPTFSLTAPLEMFIDLVAVSRGTTVPAETLGIGDASLAGQAFTLQLAPLTYRATSAGIVSTLSVLVDGLAWNEAPSFFGQPPDARVFVIAPQPGGSTEVRFGDGINGARLPTGATIVASYRFGAGAASPPAGRLTTINSPQPNLTAVRNPVAVWGGADAELPSGVRRNAPASVLTFGRAISAEDFATFAGLVPGVRRARAYWTWDDGHQRTLVKVYVGDDAGAVAAATTALAGAGDPNRPVTVAAATAIELSISGVLLIARDRVPADVCAAAGAALEDLFAAETMGIGAPLYESQIEAALLVAGVTSVRGLSVRILDGGEFPADAFPDADERVAFPAEGMYYVLTENGLGGTVVDA